MLARTDVNAVLTAAGSACEVTGLCVATGDRVVALHATIAEAAERCVSRQDFFGILGGHAAGIFSGRIVMREGVEPGDRQVAGRALISPAATLSSTPASTVTVVPEDAEAASVALGRDSLRSASVPELAGWVDALVLKVCSIDEPSS